MNPEIDVLLELFQGPLKDLELSSNKCIVRD